ncbi:LysE family translocator [Massilia sp. TS11]|uniref:LysE family translocator n=1 Tax=Massilia sp. TS11 TaxID=2908003 RepID=UPI001EDACF05|nr:LysE family translocator [Massilia sp. TS11]MCG2584943.1 LysE family translocator [Massilia sp. TS11]
MDIQLIIAFLVVQTSLSVIPGPAVLKVVGTAISGSRAQAGLVALGVIAGNGVYIALSIAGLGALLRSVPESLKVINVLGAAYLCWVAIGALRATAASSRLGEIPQVLARGGAFRLGLVSQLANPKSIIFFGALLPQFVSPHGWPAGLQMAVLGLISAVQELPVLLAYAWLADRIAQRFDDGRAVLWMKRIGGLLLLAAAALVLKR